MPKAAPAVSENVLSLSFGQAVAPSGFYTKIAGTVTMLNDGQLFRVEYRRPRSRGIIDAIVIPAARVLQVWFDANGVGEVTYQDILNPSYVDNVTESSAVLTDTGLLNLTSSAADGRFAGAQYYFDPKLIHLVQLEFSNEGLDQTGGGEGEPAAEQPAASAPAPAAGKPAKGAKGAAKAAAAPAAEAEATPTAAPAKGGKAGKAAKPAGGSTWG